MDHHQSSSLSLPSSRQTFGGSSILSLRSMRTRMEALAVYPRMRSVNSLVRERWISGKVPLIAGIYIVSKVQSFVRPKAKVQDRYFKDWIERGKREAVVRIERISERPRDDLLFLLLLPCLNPHQVPQVHTEHHNTKGICVS